ncbi:MAG: deoxycytidylate deaminase [Candidatus Anammoxibacter sp.]
MKRPTWDEYFQKITFEVAQRSTCLRRQVGALLVVDKHILTTGYNGVPHGIKHCDDVGCLRVKNNVPSGERHELCRGLHAEMNAIIQAAKYGIKITGATLYSTNYPCVLCAKLLINAEVKRIVTWGDYPDGMAKEMLNEANVKVDIIGAFKTSAKSGRKTPRKTSKGKLKKS